MLMTGGTPAQSRVNLLTWLDAIIYQVSATSLALDIDGNRENVLYHHMKGSAYDRVSGILSGLNAWQEVCTNAGISCGKFRGGGEESVNMQHTRLGSFI